MKRSFTHTLPFTQPLLLTQDYLIYRSQDTDAVYTTDTSLSYEKTIHSVESYLADALYKTDTHSLVC